MKLYEVNAAIMEAIDILDEADGEVNETTTQVMEELDALEMERDRILEYLAKFVLNIRSEAAAIKAEEDRLKKRRQALEHKEDRIIGILDRECAGEKKDLGVAILSYRKSESLEVTNLTQTISWLQSNGHEDCIRTPAPEIMKDAVKKLVKNDTEVPGVSLVTKNNCSLK